MEKFCRQCGAPLEDGVKFCTECGTPILEEEPTIGATPIVPPADPEATVGKSYGFAASQQPPAAAPAAPQQPQYTPPQQPQQPQYASQQPQYQQQPQYGQQPQYQQPQYGQQQPQYQQPQYAPQQPQYQQPQYAPQQPQYQQPQYAPQQPQYQQPQYAPQQPQYQQPPAAPVKQKKKKTWVIPVVIVLVVAILAGGFFLLKDQLFGGKGVGDDYNALCDMTSLGTQSYLYARLLTEQLIGTDVATAEPESISKLLTECLAAWDATESVTGKISSMAATLAQDKRLGSLDASRASGSLFVTTARAAGEAEAMAQTMTAAESVDRCALLAGQLAGDVAVGRSRVQDMQRVYSGRATSMLDWEGVADNAAEGFTAAVFLCGTISGGTRSIHTLDPGLKAGSLAITGADIVADVGTNGTCIVMGQGNGVTMNQEELADYLPGGDSAAITMSTYPADPNEIGITFHSTGLSRWFILDRVGGFNITRGNKDGGNAVTPPEVGGVTVNPDGMDENQIRETLGNNGVTPPPPGSGDVSDFLPPTGNANDIQNASNTISGENDGSSGTAPVPPTTVDGNTLTIRRNEEGAGSGDITVSLLWGTADDLDLHMDTPDGGHIYYGNRDAGGGTLDVDMNARSIVESPIENIYFPTPADGHYRVYLRDFRDRTDGQTTHYLVRIVINGEERTFEGDIDGSSIEVTILEFDYLGPEENTQPPAPTEQSMNELLSAAGAGQGDITVSLAWNTIDDVDLHIINPDESHIYYGHRSAGGGDLDVDANAGSQRITNPVENIYYAAPSNGHYKVYIKDFSDRTDETTDYMVRVTIGGQSQVFTGTIDSTGTEIVILEFDYGGATGGQGDSTFDGHSYGFIETDMSWTQARAYCQTLGGHLVTITSAEEQAFIESQYPGCTGWIGAYGDGTTWNWITGEPWSYTHWNSGEPNNQNGDEWFAHLYSGMNWNDLNDEDTGHFHHGFICEWDSLPDLNESTLNEGLINAGALTGEITISMTWNSTDDLDLHVITPDGNEIYWNDTEVDGGVLDVDANSDEDYLSTTPVENVYFASPANGEYWVYILDYEDRSEGDTEYLVRVTIGDESQVFTGTINEEDDFVEVVGFQYNGASD